LQKNHTTSSNIHSSIQHVDADAMLPMTNADAAASEDPVAAHANADANAKLQYCKSIIHCMYHASSKSPRPQTHGPVQHFLAVGIEKCHRLI
jgi:hypothetical protein